MAASGGEVKAKLTLDTSDFSRKWRQALDSLNTKSSGGGLSNLKRQFMDLDVAAKRSATSTSSSLSKMDQNLRKATQSVDAYSKSMKNVGGLNPSTMGMNINQLKRMSMEMDNAGKKTNTLGQTIRNSGVAMMAAGAGIVAAWGMVAYTAIQAASSSEQSWGRFTVAIGRTGMDIQRTQNEYSGVVDSIVADTGRLRGDIISGMGSLAKFGVTTTDVLKNSMESISALAYLTQSPDGIAGISESFAKIINKPQLLKKSLTSMGIDLKKFDEVMKSHNLTEADWANLTVEQRANLLNETVALQNGAAANEAYKQSYEGMVNALTNAYKKFMVTVGRELLPVLKDIGKWAIPALQGVVDWFKKLPGPIKEAVILLPLVFGGLLLLGGAAMLISPLVTGFNALAFSLFGVQGAAGSAMAALSPILALAAAGIIIYLTIDKASQDTLDQLKLKYGPHPTEGEPVTWDPGTWNPGGHSGEYLQGLGTMLSKIGVTPGERGAGSVLSMPGILTGFMQLPGMLQTVFGKGGALGGLGDIGGMLQSVFGKGGGVGTFGGILGGITGLKTAFTGLVASMVSGWSSVTGTLGSRWNSFKNKFTSTVNRIRSIWRSVVTFLKSIWDAAVNSIKTAWNTITTTIQNVVGSLKSKWDESIQYIVTRWTELREWFAGSVATFTTAWNNAVNAIKNVWNTGIGFLRTVWSNFLTTFVNIGASIKTAWNNVVNSIKTTWSNAVNWLRDVYNNLKRSIESNPIVMKINKVISGGPAGPPNSMGVARGPYDGLSLRYEGYGGHQKNPFTDGGMTGNCVDMSLGLIALAGGGELVNGSWGGNPHVWARIDGRDYDPARKALDGVWTPPSRGPSGDSYGGNTFNITVEGPVYGVRDLDRKMEESARKAYNRVAGANRSNACTF